MRWIGGEMGFFRSMFGSGRPGDAALHSRMQSQLSSGSSQNPDSPGGSRRELLRVVLRDTLNRHGIPTAWIAAEVLSSTRGGERVLHWRMHIKHWDPRLLTHAVALQNALIRRVMTFDPLAGNWLSGISWQFHLDDESACPPLPHPTAWTLTPRKEAAPEPEPEPEAAGNVIEGPVHIDALRADLDQLLAVRDADFQKHDAAHAWASTEPAKLGERR